MHSSCHDEPAVCPCVSVKAVYSELHHTLMSISEQDDVKWWRNHHGPGMPTDWPKIEVCSNEMHIIMELYVNTVFVCKLLLPRNLKLCEYLQCIYCSMFYFIKTLIKMLLN